MKIAETIDPSDSRHPPWRTPIPHFSTQQQIQSAPLVYLRSTSTGFFQTVDAVSILHISYQSPLRSAVSIVQAGRCCCIQTGSSPDRVYKMLKYVDSIISASHGRAENKHLDKDVILTSALLFIVFGRSGGAGLY